MTFQPSQDQIAAALDHAAQSQPLEACGVIADDRYFPLQNTATDHDTFVMDMKGYVAIARQHKVEAIVHSHVYQRPRPSDADRAMCEKTALPWLIVSWPLGAFEVIEPSGWRAPLVGRAWGWGSHDCFGLVRDGFHEYTGILLPEFDREWMWWKNGGDIIATQFEQAGMIRLAPDTPPQHCDVLGMKIRSPVVNHLGLFLAPDILLHQMMGRMSVREVYGGIYRSATILHLRHRDFMGGPP
jgi:proteasome lid subunit RPN8/RPN11